MTNRKAAKIVMTILVSAMTVCLFLDEEIDLDSLYYYVNDLCRDGDLYDDGTWHANSEGGPNRIKVVVKQ